MSNLKVGIQINCFGQGWSSKKAYFDRYRQHSFEPEKCVIVTFVGLGMPLNWWESVWELAETCF